MAFGQKQGSLKNLKKSLAKGGGKGFIKYIPKNGSMNVRFIQEPEEWVNYVEHYDQVARKSFPCNGEQNCPGCMSGERKSSRYLANVVDLDDNNRVVPLQMPKDLANRLVVKYEKWGSITDRDIELSRQGEGLDTVYDLDPSVPDRKRIDKYQPIDLLKVLEDAFNAVFGDDDDEDEEEVKPAAKKSGVRGRKQSPAARAAKGTTLEDEDEEEDEKPAPRKRAAAKKAAAKPPVDDEDEVDEEEEEPEPPKKSTRKKAAVKEPEFEPDEDEEDEAEEDEPEADESEEDEEEYTEEDLRAMPFGALRAVAREFGVSTKGKNADAIIEEIMEMGEEVDEPA